MRVGVLRALHIAEYPISDDDWKRAYAEVRAQYPAATFLKAPLAWIGLGLSGHLWGRAGVQAYPLSPTRYRLCQRRDSGEDREAESSKTLPGRHSQKLLLLQNQQVLKSVWLKLFVCTLQHLHIGPRLSRQSPPAGQRLAPLPVYTDCGRRLSIFRKDLDAITNAAGDPSQREGTVAARPGGLDPFQVCGRCPAAHRRTYRQSE